MDRTLKQVPSSPGTLVGLVQPRATNDSSRQTLVYELLGHPPTRTSSTPFFLDYASGKLRTVRPLDREAAVNYTLVVKATDLTAIAPPRSATASVLIKVLDENDNAPKFVDQGGRPMGNPLYISVQEEGLPGTQLFRFRAPDPDAGLNGTVAYSFRGDTSVLEYFNLGAVSGILRMVKPIDRELVEQLAFEVSCLDADEKQRRGRLESLSALSVFIHQ